MHTYASVSRFKDFIRDQGSSDLGQGNDALYLSALESASRRVEGFCHRSSTGGGFGPRIATNRYDGCGENELHLNDDLLSTTAFTVAQATGQAGVSPVVDTDYFLSGFGNYATPYRKIVLHGMGSPTVFGTGYRTVVVTGTWGYSDTTILSGTTMASGFAASTTATVFITSASPDLSPGQTLLVGAEAMYLSALDGTNATVTRGANGTTAAVHADASVIYYYTYPEDIVAATLAVALRRLKLRDAGADGQWGGGQIPATSPRDTENSLLWATLRDYVIPIA